MNEQSYGLLVDDLARSISQMKLPYGAEEVSEWAVSRNVDEKGLMDAIALFELMYMANYENKREMLSDTSGIPRDERICTFGNYDMRNIPKDNVEAIMALKTLSFLKSGCNVIISGDYGTGKTHIAQAIGNECIDHLVRTSFQTLSSMKAKISKAIKNGTVASFVSNIAGVQCLIIDDIDKSSLTKEESLVLFDVVNRKYSTKGAGSLVITSNTQPSQWNNIFQDPDLAACILDRIFDRSYCFHFTGSSYRGKNKVVTQVNFGSVPVLPKVR
ncbi:MAG: ATP-binding protein [Candidatus Cryptobacteroides sp.]